MHVCDVCNECNICRILPEAPPREVTHYSYQSTTRYNMPKCTKADTGQWCESQMKVKLLSVILPSSYPGMTPGITSKKKLIKNVFFKILIPYTNFDTSPPYLERIQALSCV